MDFQLRNKHILLISTEPWGKLLLSKHNYAITLSNRNNKVFFLNPPSLKSKFLEINRHTEHENLYIVDYSPIYRGKRFIPAFLLNFLMYVQGRIIKKILPTPLDVVWSFTPLYKNLKVFGAKLNLFFAYDFLYNGEGVEVGETADAIFSISSGILDQFRPYQKPKFKLNHGLSNPFAQLAQEEIKQSLVKGKNTVKVGYIGNLLQEFIDRATFQEIVRQNPAIDFILWGPYKLQENNLGGWMHQGVLEFIDFLKNQPNVFLKGPTPPLKIAEGLRDIDATLLCYDIGKYSNYDGSNSHKILEYLSCGKVLIANHVSELNNRSDIIQMLDDTDNANLPVLFQHVINNLSLYNSVSLQSKRKQFTLNNTYEAQIEKIENMLSSIKNSAIQDLSKK